MSYDQEYETGYDMAVGEIEAGAIAIQKSAAARGIQIARPVAQALAARRITVARPQPVPAQRGTGMTTGLPMGTATFAATAAGTVANLTQAAQETFTARKLIISRSDYNAVPPAACAGIPFTVTDVRIGNRSVLAGAAGMPVEAFAPTATGGQALATGVEVREGKQVLVQITQGAVAVPAGETVFITAYFAGNE